MVSQNKYEIMIYERRQWRDVVKQTRLWNRWRKKDVFRIESKQLWGAM